MPRRRARVPRISSDDSGFNALIQSIQAHREAPALEEDRQQVVRERAVKNALDMLSLGADKNQVARELGKVGIVLPEREVTDRALAHPLGAGEDPEAAAFIPRTETTRREVDTSGLETPRDIAARESATIEGRETRGRQQAFDLGQRGVEAGVQREDVRREQFPTTDELWSGVLKKIKDGVPLTPEDNRFVADAVKLRSGDPGAKRHFENEIIEQFRTGGRESLNTQQREYYDSNIRTRDPEALRRTEERAVRGEERSERGLSLSEERLGVAKEGQQAAGARATKSQASNERNRVFDDIDRARQVVEKKYVRQRETVSLSPNRQQDLARIDAQEDAELAQVTERMKKRFPKYAQDIDAQFGSGGSGRPAPRPSFLDLFNEGPKRQGTPQG